MLDGLATYQLLRLLGQDPTLRFVVDRKHLKEAIYEATTQSIDVLHLSCHGDDEGIQLTDYTDVSWTSFARYFQEGHRCPNALVMSSCFGAARQVSSAFRKVDDRPAIIFGTTEARKFSEYAVAWAILYRRFKLSGVHRDAAQRALRQICAVVHPSFLYRRWDKDEDTYLRFPPEGKKYIVEEVDDEDEEPQSP
jgi:hypothetical protein